MENAFIKEKSMPIVKSGMTVVIMNVFVKMAELVVTDASIGNTFFKFSFVLLHASFS